MNSPVAVSDLRKILNKTRAVDLQISNFSVSCKTLKDRGYLLKYRDKITLRVAYRLTEKGMEEGEKEYVKRMNTIT
ncbi:hypothetical protein [Xenorhabdus sp. KJ12.1]|uniref:hypothetical protein n=1 Tax=Xenorhabdus sp. KJ12.1 TaxID=1851571 RepID=UPI00187BF356|nr:hypothetical protein [Xenorhabdus sp. KJ12.1]